MSFVTTQETGEDDDIAGQDTCRGEQESKSVRQGDRENDKEPVVIESVVIRLKREERTIKTLRTKLIILV
jgi:hypothetical protein